MDDPIYAQKYADGASKQDLPGKIKQALDARHTKYLQGWLVSGGAQVRPDSGATFGTIDIGRELYDTNYLTTRLSLSGLAGEDLASVGLDTGVRLQAPTRLAPFVGVGGTAGLLLEDAVPLLLDTATDSMDSPISLENNSSDSVGGLAAIYPEVGLHFWFDGHIRLTAFGRYMITTEGRQHDDWLIGGQFTFFTR